MNLAVRLGACALCVGLLLTFAVSVVAHPMSFGSVRLERTASSLEGELVLDVPEDVQQLPERRRRAELESQVAQGFRLRLLGTTTAPEVTILDLGEGDDAVDVVRVHFALSSRGQPITLSTSSELGDVAVELVDKETRSRDRAVIEAGGSRTLSLEVTPAGEASARVQVQGSESTPTQEKQSQTTPSSGADAPGSADVPWSEYLSLGVFHILPAGVDHLLFILSLVLLIETWLPLLGLLSLFTLGHAASVLLGVYGWANVDPAFVEPLIALSIAYAAFEARRPTLSWLRPYVVALFGVVHGLGFARALLRVGVADDQRWAAVASFNLGVELGQLTAAVPVFALLSLLARRSDLTRARMLGLSLLAAVGFGWAALRVFGVEV